MIKEAIHQLVQLQNLDRETTEQCMQEIMTGAASPDQIAAFLTAMRMKGETVEEITGCASVMREHCIPLRTNINAIEIVGTGGDEANTFNISTTTAFVVAAAGMPVTKHGNRSVSSKCGAADVLEALGANINLTPDQNVQVLRKSRVCFMFAQLYHPALKYAGPVRKNIGIRTVFNILGPLTNPANAKIELMGVYEDKLVEPMARVLMNLGVKRGIVVCGGSKLDEATVTGRNRICEIDNGQLKNYVLSPQNYGFWPRELKDLEGGTPEENAEITLDILNGKIWGAMRETVILNAGLCLYLSGKANGLHSAIALATDVLNSGKAAHQLETFIKATNSFDE